nr:MAG TPA: hypothetical protein [Herelleviridae sp.]
MAKPDWITLSKTSGTGNDTVTVTAAKNTGTSARSGSITVKSGSLSKVVTISQEGQTHVAIKIAISNADQVLNVADHNPEVCI